MPNFFFLSFDNSSVFRHAKISIKFDNKRKGKARVSIRSTLETSDENLEFYFLIKNDEDPITLEDIRPDYNEYLENSEFLEMAGAYHLKKEIVLDHCSIFCETNSDDDNCLEGDRLIHPRLIACEEVRDTELPEPLTGVLTKRDIVLRVKAVNQKEIKDEVSQVVEGSNSFFCQFRIFLGDFVSSQNLAYWESSSKSWSIDFSLHKERAYERLVDKLVERRILKYPISVELWFSIPHSHIFVASSPVYEKAFRLKREDIEYKTDWREVGEFQTREGDYAVKIVNQAGHFAEFSIICVSPFRPGEDPEELKNRIDSLKEDVRQSIQIAEEKFITWKEVATPLILMVTLLSLVVSVTVALAVRMEGYNETIMTSSGTVDLTILILSAVFTGIVVWAIAFSMSFLSGRYLARRKGNIMAEEAFPPNLARAIIIVWLGLYSLAIAIIYDLL